MAFPRKKRLSAGNPKSSISPLIWMKPWSFPLRIFSYGEKKEAEDAFLSTLAEVTSLAVHNFPSSGFGMAAERFEQAHWKLDRQKILPLLGAAQKGSPLIILICKPDVG